MADRVIKLEGRGLRGESLADVARRTGAFGVLPTDSDSAALAKYGEGVASSTTISAKVDAADEARAASELARDQAADLVRPENIFVDVPLATAEEDVAEGTTFKIVDSVTQLATVYKRTASGSVELYKEATEAALRQRGTEIVGARGGVSSQMFMDRLAGGQIGQLQAVRYEDFTESATSPSPVGMFDDLLFGYFNNTIYTKATELGPWSSLTACPGRPVHLLKMNDGEVILITSSQIYKSSGWGTGAVAWNLKVTNSGGTAAFLGFSTAGTNGVKMIVGEYATGGPDAGWSNSQKAWATTDGGENWTVIYDQVARYGANTAADTHIHGCAYDAEQDIFLLSEGHTSVMGIYWTPADLGGIAWTRIEKGQFGAVRVEGQPTNVVPAPFGIVCASDAPDQGLWRIERGETAGEMRVEPLYEWPAGRGGTLGYGQCHFVDPLTGVVYLGFRHNHVPNSRNPLAIFASNGGAADIVWQGDDATIPSAGQANDIIQIVVTPWRTVIGRTAATSEVGSKLITGKIVNAGRRNADTGKVLGGTVKTATGAQRSVAIGTGSLAAADAATAVGATAQATGANSVAVGKIAIVSGTNSVAIGSDAQALGNSAFVGGYNSRAGGSSIVLGAGRDLSALTSVISIGATQNITQSGVVAVGQSVTLTGAGSVVVGSSAQSSGTFGLALGNSANCAHVSGIALGQASATTANHQLAIGPRHLKLETPTTIPPAAANEARLYSDVSGGKRRLMVQFPTGAAIAIATEA